MDIVFNFDEVIYQNDTTWWHETIKFALDVLIGILTGIAGAVIILWIQFEKSTNHHSLLKIESATRELYEEIRRQRSATDKASNSDSQKSAIRNIFKHYLSVIIDSLFNTYGGGDLQASYQDGKELHPCLIHYKWDEQKKQFEDRWNFFYGYVQNLMEPLNSYAFLASIPLIRRCKKIKKIKTLALLVNQIELIVGIHDGIIDNAAREYVIVDKDAATFIIKDGHNNKIELINRLQKELKILKQIWLNWVTLSIENKSSHFNSANMTRSHEPKVPPVPSVF